MVASRLLLRVFVVCVLAGAGVLAAAPRCLACDCVFQPPAKIVAGADAVFIGEVTAETPVDPVTTIQTFEVRKVFKGVVLSRIDVVAQIGPGGGSPCAVSFPAGSQVVVAVHRNDDGSWSSDACSVLTVAAMKKVAGPGRAPKPAPPSPSATSTPSRLPAPGAGAGFPGWLVPLLGAAGGTLLIALSILAGGRRARNEVPRGEGPGDGEDEVG